MQLNNQEREIKYILKRRYQNAYMWQLNTIVNFFAACLIYFKSPNPEILSNEVFFKNVFVYNFENELKM